MSRKLNLMLHAGGQEASLEAVQAIETPEHTDTWYPIPHMLLINQIMGGLQSVGMTVTNTVHGLWKNGLRYFGLMQIENEQNQDYALVAGLRNSHDKSFPSALCLGSAVFVCDNLAFSGEIVIGRRHTKYIERDLPGLVATALGRLANLRHVQEKRIESYKQVQLNDMGAHDLLVKAFDQRIIGPQRIKGVLENWRKPPHEEFCDRNVWSYFNAFTEALKPRVRQGNQENNNLIALPVVTQKLHGLMDTYCGLDLSVQREEIMG